MAGKSLVLDANILIRAVPGKKVRTLLEQYSASVCFFTPDVCFEDAEKYLPSIFEKRNLPPQPAFEVLARVSRIVQTIDPAIYDAYIMEAKQCIAVRDVEIGRLWQRLWRSIALFGPRTQIFLGRE